MNTQCLQIKEALEKGETLTGIDALQRFGTMKLATRIGEVIRNFGLDVAKIPVITSTGKRVMSYRLRREAVND